MRSNNTKNRQYRLRMSDQEFNELEELSIKTGEDKAEIIRKALKSYANLVKYLE